MVGRRRMMRGGWSGMATSTNPVQVGEAKFELEAALGVGTEATSATRRAARNVEFGLRLSVPDGNQGESA
jgi:hypothetical protein